MRGLSFLLLAIVWTSCNNNSSRTLFTEVTAQSGVEFINQLSFTEKLNPYTYRNFYNGAGVAVGDINNDGFLDIYFAGNQVENKLYLNLGDFNFKDITVSAGVNCSDVWSTGVTIVDVNGDGWNDIYVCKSGNPDASHRYNELFINNRDLTFTEMAKEFGLDVIGLSVQAAFFDYDKDGDLDCYLLTNSLKSVGNFDLAKNLREVPDTLNGGNKFFINDNGRFRDYSAQSGIYRSAIGFGLGITLGDFNHDGWVDVYVSNDFFERDYLYINNQKGGFTESLTSFFQSISMGSMGADYADLDNDGLPELFVTEMLPDSLSRKKSKTVYEGWNKYQLNLENGYYHQFSRNVLQKQVDDESFVEIGRLAGISASEWSWGALLFDMDNDGLRDIFIANGIYKDLLDRDYLTFTGAEENVRKIIKEEKDAILKLIDLMPSSTFPNYAFKNTGNLSFINNAQDWGLGDPMFSCGSAYGDFDNDGDLDLVINNINSPSRIFRNNSDSAVNKFLSISLEDSQPNTEAIGSVVELFYQGNRLVADNFVSRGFQSSVTSKINFGLGKEIKRIDSMQLTWPDGYTTAYYNLKTNQRFHIKRDRNDFKTKPLFKRDPMVSFLRVVSSDKQIKHQSSGLVDFNRDRLLPLMYSNETPYLTVGDINNDGAPEIYVSGGKGQAGSFIQILNNDYTLKELNVVDPGIEETGCLLFDADNDNDLDLYIAAGGRFYSNSSSLLQDQLLINDGKGKFNPSKFRLPFARFVASSAVKAIDFDRDGDNDLLIGERFDPFYYGLGGSAYLFENVGHGEYKDVTEQFAPVLKDIGMVTDFSVGDFDADGSVDFVVVGDWMPVYYFRNTGTGFTDVSSEMGLKNLSGWWHKIINADFNKDGIADFVIGNQGLNSFFKSGDRLYVNDFDRDGSVEQIYCTLIDGKYLPIIDKDDFISQFPALKKDLLYYKDYSKRSIDAIFPKSVLDKSKIHDVNELASILILSNKNKYDVIKLPLEAQFSPIYGLEVMDLNNDGVVDLIAGGNQYSVKPQYGRSDASHGWYFKGKLKDNEFAFERGESLGVLGEIRDIIKIEVGNKKFIVFAKYNDYLEVYKVD